jgi:hypothetical protein
MDIHPLASAEKREHMGRLAALLRESMGRHPHHIDLTEAEAIALIRPVIEDVHSIVVGVFDGDALVYFTASRPILRAFPFGHPLLPWLAKNQDDAARVLYTPYAGIAGSHRGRGIVLKVEPVLWGEIERRGFYMRVITIAVSDEASGLRSQHGLYEKLAYSAAPVPVPVRQGGRGETARYYFKRVGHA